MQRLADVAVRIVADLGARYFSKCFRLSTYPSFQLAVTRNVVMHYVPHHAYLTADQFAEDFYHAANASDPEVASSFFGRFDYLSEFSNRNFQFAIDKGQNLLSQCRHADPQAYGVIHKGFPYYWMGVASFFTRDYEKALFFIDAAVSEDIRAGYHHKADMSLALRFVQIKQADRQYLIHNELMEMAENIIQELINDYNCRTGCASPPLTLDAIRIKFLKKSLNGSCGWRSLMTSFISFALELEDRGSILDLRPDGGTAEPFFLHLFKGCLLFESLLKANSSKTPGNSTLGGILNELSLDLIGRQQRWSIGGTTLPEIISDLACHGRSLEEAIRFTGRMRNTLGHDLGWGVNLDRGQFSCLARMVSASCMHTIARFYH